MSIRFYAVKCPDCGATLDIEEGRKQLFCSFCGANVIVTNENEYIYREIDEARIKEAEIEQAIRIKELEMEQLKRNRNESLQHLLTYLWIASILVVVSICIYAWISKGGMVAFLCFLYIGIPVVGGGAHLLFNVFPKRFQ